VYGVVCCVDVVLSGRVMGLGLRRRQVVKVCT
jgi:hypothetical protein